MVQPDDRLEGLRSDIVRQSQALSGMQSEMFSQAPIVRTSDVAAAHFNMIVGIAYTGSTTTILASGNSLRAFP
jgi:hypothetical protein